MDEPVVCREVGTSYTCIRTSVSATHTTYVTMADLRVDRLSNKEFAQHWKPYEVYPVGRAAQVYLGAGQYREIDPQVKKLLEQILSNPATPVELDPVVFPSSTSHQKETVMSEAQTAAASETKTSKVKNAPAAKKAAKSAPGKQAVAAKKPAKKAAPAPAAKKAAKSAPGKQAVAAVAQTLTKGSAKQTEAAKKPLGRPVSNEKLKVLDPEAPRRGATADFVTAAVKLKTFTRQELADAMIKAGYEEKAARIKVADMVYFEVIGPAK